MSQRDQNQSYVDRLRDTEERLNRLESSKNTAIKRNDLRLTDTLVTADSPANKLCLENLETGEKICIGEQTAGDLAQASWSFSGDIVLANVGDASPAHVMERAATARQIVIAQPCGHSFTGTLRICVDFCDSGVTTQLLISLPGASSFVVREINVPMIENDRIVLTIFNAGTTAANNISVFVRFGTPTVGVTTGAECAS